MAANPSIVTRDTDVLASKTTNIYESVFVVSKRAQQIAIKSKEELSHKLSEFASSVDNLEEIFENREQIEISKYYERQPKPTSVSLDEFLNDQIVMKYRDEDQNV